MKEPKKSNEIWASVNSHCSTPNSNVQWCCELLLSKVFLQVFQRPHYYLVYLFNARHLHQGPELFYTSAPNVFEIENFPTEMFIILIDNITQVCIQTFRPISQNIRLFYIRNRCTGKIRIIVLQIGNTWWKTMTG
jgi:hypothetical protein